MELWFGELGVGGTKAEPGFLLYYSKSNQIDNFEDIS